MSRWLHQASGMDFVPENFTSFFFLNIYATSTIRPGPVTWIDGDEIESLRVNLAKHHQQA